MQPIAVTDPGYVPAEQPGAFDRWARGLVNDPRDVPFVALLTQMALLQLPLAVALFVVRPLPWWLALAYVGVTLGVFIDRFTLMLHNTSHRRLFDKDHRWMNQLIPWVFGPLYGQTPGTYFAHHMGMHHREGNLPDDLSSTMRFKRDSFLHWLRYYGRFMTIGIFELALYFKKRDRAKLMRMAIVGETAWFAVIGLGLWLAPVPTLIVFVGPFVFMRFMMMAGNWGQHAFVDPDEPDNDYKSSITCINTRYNRRCFNDGYHIGHHVKASRHWSEMPDDFLANREEYRRQDALVFEGVDFFMVWGMLMFKRYRSLAQKVVDLGHGRSVEEIEAILRHRTQPITDWQPPTR